MFNVRLCALSVFACVMTSQLAGCSSEVVASESPLSNRLWAGFHADIRLVVYDDMNPNFSRRKVAYTGDLSTAEDRVKAVVNALTPTTQQLHCSENGKIYVLEIEEAGAKRKFTSHNNACNTRASYAGFVNTDSLAHLAQALSEGLPH